MASPVGRKVGLWLGPPLGAAYLRLVRGTMRLRRVGAENALPADGAPVIYAFWHEQLAMMPWVQFRPPTYVPISQSDDGEITARLFAWLGVAPLRGSSSRGGAEAARGMLGAIRQGHDLGITPDGPRGPARQVQPGATWIAKVSGRPLLPVGFACTRARRLRTWDQMLLPLPLSRGVFAYGDHVWVPEGATPEQLQQAGEELGRRIEDAGRRARAELQG